MHSSYMVFVTCAEQLAPDPLNGLDLVVGHTVIPLRKTAASNADKPLAHARPVQVRVLLQAGHELCLSPTMTLGPVIIAPQNIIKARHASWPMTRCIGRLLLQVIFLSYRLRHKQAAGVPWVAFPAAASIYSDHPHDPRRLADVMATLQPRSHLRDDKAALICPSRTLPP